MHRDDILTEQESLVQPSRLFVREGQMFESANDRPPKRRFVVLFTGTASLP